MAVNFQRELAFRKEILIMNGKYRLTRKVGAGSFGDIYLGINTINGERSTGPVSYDCAGSELSSSALVRHAVGEHVLACTVRDSFRSPTWRNFRAMFPILNDTARRSDVQ